MTAAKPRKQHNCPLGVAFTTSGEPAFLFCKTWGCRRCAKKLAFKWAIRAQAAFCPDETGVVQKRWFLTLTLGSYYKTPEQGFGSLKKLWDKTRKAFQRANPQWEYLAFIEGQPERDFMPHFHILSAQLPPAKLGRQGKITKRSLHDWAVSLGWGFEVDLKPVDGAAAAFYVSKYASKSSPYHPKNLRRVRASRAWPKAPKEVVKALILRKKGEALDSYLMRVAVECDKTMYDLHTLYLTANQELAQLVKMP